MKKKKFANGGPSYENNIRDGGTSFIDEFEKSRAKVKTDEEKPRFETKEGENEMISKIPGIRERAMEMVNLDTDAEPLITKDAPVTKPARPSLPTRAAFVKKANEAGFTADQTGGGAALLTRRDRRNTKPMYKSGGKVKSASSRADGCAVKGKTKGRMV